MHTAFVGTLGALAISQVLAAPASSSSSPTGIHTLGKRDGGNTDLTVFGKASVSFGDQTPWSVLDTLGDHCSGGTCELAQPWTVPATFVTGPQNEAQQGTITITVQEASYEVWARNALIETLKTLSSNTYSVNHTTYQEGSSCQVATGTPCNPGTPVPIDQYSGSDSYYIRYHPNPDTNSFIQVNVASSVGDDSDVLSSICKDITALGAAVGSVMGTDGVIAAAGFTVGSLACGS